MNVFPAADHTVSAFRRNAIAVAVVSLFAAPAIAGPAPAPVQCKSFLVGTWHGENFVKDVSSVSLTITYEADGKFSAERVESKGTTSASDDRPVGTWDVKPAESPSMCQIVFTNGFSGETTSEWIDVAGPDTYRTGHGDGALDMQRQNP